MSKKSKKKAGKNTPLLKKNASVEPLSSPEKPFDFGGIPDRNFKKNLGCG